MNKKFLRVMSLLLSVMMFFGCVVVANAEEATEKITVSIRVEGRTKNLANREIPVPKSTTVKEIIDGANLDVEYDEKYNNDIVSVKGEQETKSEWQYAVGGKIRKEDISVYKVEEGTEIILFNAAENAVMPSWNADEVAVSGVITFMGTDKNGATAPIDDATILWEVAALRESHKTDKKGKIYLPQESLEAGRHSVQIEKLNNEGVPTVVRFAPGTEIDVPKIEAGEKGEMTLFDEIYYFFLDIFEGIVEVWKFYINAIVGLFKGNSAE